MPYFQQLLVGAWLRRSRLDGELGRLGKLFVPLLRVIIIVSLLIVTLLLPIVAMRVRGSTRVFVHLKWCTGEQGSASTSK